MKVTIWNGKEFEYEFDTDEQDIKKMYMYDLIDNRTDVIDEREEYDDKDERGLVLDEVLAALENEIAERKEKKQLTNDFLLDIVEQLDDFLEEKGVQIPIEDKEGQEAGTNFWGDDFDWLMNMLREKFRQAGVVIEDEWEN